MRGFPAGFALTMFNWFTYILASATTTITFFTIFLVGVVFSVFSLILGGHSDQADHDIGHDVGHDVGHDAGHDASHDTGADHGGHSDSGDHADGGAGFTSLFSVGMFSVRGVALLSTGFGGIGFLIFVATQRVLFSTAAAFVG